MSRVSLVWASFAVAVALSCGGSAPMPRSEGAAPPRSPRRHGLMSSGSDKPPTAGSSDGTTCEQARDQYVEEIQVGGAAGAADLKADDFGTVLNNGGYLNACGVQESSKVRICAAVQNGRAVGVTVALDPPLPEAEVCVAGQVRLLSFPSHSKLDVVTVNF